MSISCNSCKHESLLYSDNPCKSCVSYCNFESNLEEKARVEAIKEFAEAVKNDFVGEDYSEDRYLEICHEGFYERIDDLVKKMVGEQK